MVVEAALGDGSQEVLEIVFKLTRQMDELLDIMPL
jgi:hypothetical protein